MVITKAVSQCFLSTLSSPIRGNTVKGCSWPERTGGAIPPAGRLPELSSVYLKSSDQGRSQLSVGSKGKRPLEKLQIVAVEFILGLKGRLIIKTAKPEAMKMITKRPHGWG